MRWFASLVLALAFIAAPPRASAQPRDHGADDESLQSAKSCQYGMPILSAEGLFVVCPMLGEVAAPRRHSELALLLIPRHLQHRIPQASPEKSFGLEYKEQEELERKKERSRGAKAGIAIGAIVGGSAVIFGISAAVFVTTY